MICSGQGSKGHETLPVFSRMSDIDVCTSSVAYHPFPLHDLVTPPVTNTWTASEAFGPTVVATGSVAPRVHGMNRVTPS